MNSEDMKELKELIEFLKENKIGEFDLERGDLKVRIKFAQEGGGTRPRRHGTPAGGAGSRTAACADRSARDLRRARRPDSRCAGRQLKAETGRRGIAAYRQIAHRRHVL